jgi:hypothetical protein
MNRIKAAVEFLLEGRPFTVENLTLGINEENDFYVTGWSQYANLENLTKSIASDELNGIKEQFADMLKNSPDLTDFILGKSVKYNLAFNYGMGSLGICSEKDGVLTWHVSLK